MRHDVIATRFPFVSRMLACTGFRAANVAIGTNVVATFSEAMNPATLATTSFKLSPTSGGTAVATSITYDAGTGAGTLNPTTENGLTFSFNGAFAASDTGTPWLVGTLTGATMAPIGINWERQP